MKLKLKMMNKVIGLFIKRFASKSPKFFAVIRNIAILLLPAWEVINQTEWGEVVNGEVYGLVYGILIAIIGTAQLTTTKKEIMDEDANHRKATG